MQTIKTDIQRKPIPDAVKAKPKLKATKKAKANGKPKATKKAKANGVVKAKVKVNRGGGKALSDFTNEDKIKVLKGKDIARRECFRSGQTVAQNLTAQKAAGYRGRRKYIRKQVRLGRVRLS